MKSLFKALIIPLAFFIPFTLAAQDILSLEEAIRVGLENNYSIKIAANNTEIARNNLSWGNAGMLPFLSANSAVNRGVENTFNEYFNGTVREGAGAKSRSFSYNVNLGWTIFDGMGMFITYNKLAEFRKLGENNFQLQVENTISEINILYHQIVREQERLKVIENILDLSAERMEIARTKYEVGRSSKVEFLTAQVDYNADTSSYIVQLERLNDAKIDLNQIMGLVGNTNYNVQSTIFFVESLDRNELHESMMFGNTIKKRYLLESSIARYELKEIGASRYPVLNLVSSYNHGESRAEIGQIMQRRANVFNYGLNANITLFNGNNLNRRMQNARINIENSQLALEELDLRLTAQMDKAFNNYSNGLLLYHLEQKNLAVARENAEIALERYRLGNTPAIELREAQLNMAHAEHRLLDAAYSVKYSEIELLRLGGILK